MPRPIVSISPTRFADLSACMCRAAFEQDPTFADARHASPASVMGSVAHSVVEAAYRGDFAGEANPRRAAIDLWDRLVTEAAQGVPAAPEPSRWRDYQMKRLRAATQAAAVTRRQPRARSSSGEHRGTRVEEWLVSRDGRVRGRPDRIEVADGKVTVIDLKTASLDEGDVPLAYQQQLQLYAWLHHEVTAGWPDAAAIETLAGDRLFVDVDPDVCNQVAADAIKAMEAFNRLAESAANFIPLATPDVEHCRYCRYRGGCPAFVAAADESWGAFRAMVGGSLVGDEGDKNDERIRCLTVRVDAGTIEVGGQARIRGELGTSPLPQGTWVVADRVVPEVALHDYWVDWDSLLWTWATDFRAAGTGGERTTRG